MSNYVPGAGVGPVTVISRAPDKLDAFVVGLDGRIYSAAWEPGLTSWQGWWPIGDGEVAPCSQVCAISRAPNKLNLFVVGLDGRIYTAYWEPGLTSWQGWWPIGDLKTTLHAPICAVSRSTDKIDLFVAGLDGRIYTAAWEPGFTSWQGWWQVGNGKIPPGAPVKAVSRSKDKIDLFAVGLDGRVYSAAWEPGFKSWQGWWPIGNFTTVPRTPVEAVSRSADKMDIFAVGLDGRVYTAAWQPGFTAWQGWWAVGNGVVPKRAPVTAVSRSADKIDIFAAGLDGRVYSAAWEPGFTSWQGWWQVGGLVTSAQAPIGVVSRSANKLDVLAAATNNGRVMAAAWEPGDTAWRGWWFVSDGVTGMSDPGVGQWAKVGIAFQSENTNHSEEAQGVTTDGAAWFLSSNGSKTVRKYGGGAALLGEIGVPGAHIGAPGCHEGWLYVPIQGPFGVWKATTGLSSPQFIAADGGKNRFAWCDVNPLNGRLYTCEFDIFNNANGVLFAYDRDTLERRPEDDMTLGTTPIHFDRLQGGVFTRRGRLIISRSGPNGIFCFSAVTGHCFGGRHLGDFGSTGSEVEGVTVVPVQFGGQFAHVHVLELDNDEPDKDDCYLHSFAVPDPNRL